MGDLVAASARNNAQWCDVVCRAHGLSPRFEADAWTSARRTPAAFPDAVTLSTAASAQRLLESAGTMSTMSKSGSPHALTP